MKRWLLYLLMFFLCLSSAQDLDAGRKKSAFSSSHRTYHTYSYHHSSGSKKTPGVARTRKGKIKRSESEKKKFLRQHGYKHVPQGYEVDHIIPLYKGGADKAYNMQLIPKAQHRAKHHKR